MLEVSLLGQFSLRLGGALIELGARPAQTLLVYLLLHRGTAHRREQLAGLLWPDSLESTARKNLRNAVWQVRQALGEAYLDASKGTLAFNVEAPHRLDVALLEQASRATGEALADAVGAYQGELLPGFYEPWVVLERERLHAVFCRRIQALLDELIAHARWTDVQTWAEHWIAQGQVPEPAYRALMQACAARGDQAGLASAFRRCQYALHTELGVAPSAETQTLYQQLTAQAAAPAVPTATPAEPPAAPDQPDTEAGRGRLSVLDRIVHGRLIGRQAELQRLYEVWARACQGQGQLVLLAGEPGIGKTRLARELIAYAQLRGAAGLAGACYEYEAATPYLPIVEAIRDWVEKEPAPSLRERLGPAAPELARLVPEIEARLGQLAASPALAPGEERVRLFDHVARFLQSLAGDNALLLFLDDLQWADPDTLALLRYALRRLRAAPVMVLAAYRDLELDRAHPLAAALVEWNRERLSTHLALERLPQADTVALLRALLGESRVAHELADVVHRETEGNPFFVEEIVKSLVEQGDLVLEGEEWLRRLDAPLVLPQTIKDAIGRRFSRLSPACLEALRLAAAVGKVFAFEELAAAATLDEAALLDALDEAAAAQLVRPDGGQTFVFTHDKIREVLYEELNPIRQRLLHRRVGMALEQVYASAPDRAARVADLAYHFSLGGDREKALHYTLEAAARAQSLYAHAEAARHYRQALALAEALDLPEQQTVIDEHLGDVQQQRGVFQLAVYHFQRALRRLPASDRARRPVLNMKLGAIHQQVGDAGGVAYLQAAASDLDPLAQANELANTLAQLGRYQHFAGQHARAVEHYERALVLAEAHGEANTLLNIYAYMAGAYQHRADYAASRAWAYRCIELGERADFPLAVGVGHEYVSQADTCQGRWADALAHVTLAQEMAEKIGNLNRLTWCEHGRAEILYGQGDLRAAHVVALSVAARCEEIGEQWLMEWANPLLAWIEADLGLAADARQRAQAALDGVDGVDAAGHLVAQCFARHACAYTHLVRGDWAAAAGLYDECAALWDQTDNRLARLMIGPHPALAYLGLGRHDDAARLAAEYVELALQAGATHWAGCGRRVQGQVLAAQGHKAAAQHALNEAVAALEQTGSRLQLARALYQRGRLPGAGQTEAARSDLRQAQALFEACGAAPEAEQAAAALAA